MRKSNKKKKILAWRQIFFYQNHKAKFGFVVLVDESGIWVKTRVIFVWSGKKIKG